MSPPQYHHKKLIILNLQNFFQYGRVEYYLPREGTAHQASKGFMVERDSNETSLDSIPGKWYPAAWTIYPVTASIATRACFNSAARNQAAVDADPNSANPRGSHWPRGFVAPGKLSMFRFNAVLEVVVAVACCGCCWRTAAGAKAVTEPAKRRTRPDFIFCAVHKWLLYVVVEK